MLLSLRLILLLLLYWLSIHPRLATAYSWQVNTPPKQCSNLSITIVGSDGLPPYTILILPHGPSPLQNNTEVRAVINRPLEGNTTTFSFPINYPAGSEFVAVVSDVHNFGSGGASIPIRVAGSDDDSCLKAYEPLFFFYIYPEDPIQCQSTIIAWQTGRIQGTPIFQGVIPGGQVFGIQQTTLRDVTNGTGPQTGFSWIPSIRTQTEFIIIGGDDRGIGTGGSEVHTVGNSGDNSCLNSLSPSSTPGTPAGAYATGTTGGTGSSHSSGNNRKVLIGAIVGGVIGGLVLVLLTALLSFYLLRRSTGPRGSHTVPILSRSGHLNPEPYDLLTPTTASTGTRSFGSGSSILPLRKGGSGILRHEDAGPTDSTFLSGAQNTAELPPQYDDLRPSVLS
ncbi:hypothetical protein AX15_005473 [Amanita polypyramis BW_CC]|nr:hypothetical protein AX15_005473 [Amanita polypyramis BW_CC]